MSDDHLVVWKIAGCFSLALLGILGAAVPFYWTGAWKAEDKTTTGASFLSFGNMLSCGVFLGGGFLHLLPVRRVACPPTTPFAGFTSIPPSLTSSNLTHSSLWSG